MGGQSLFDGTADFSRLSPSFDSKALRIVQKTLAKVSEEGTEAAAATYAEIFTSAEPASYPKINFEVNRPFLFLIHEKSTGSILFTGEIRNL
jgi:serpin B